MTKKYQRVLIGFLLLLAPVYIVLSILVWWVPVGILTADLRPANAQDSLALVDLYNSTDGAHWTNRWDLEAPVYTWHGVRLDTEGRVVRLGLKSNNALCGYPKQPKHV